MNIQEILQRARLKSGAMSNRALARRLGLSTSGVVVLLEGKHHPSDEVMLRIAEAAELREDDALMWLNIWRSKGRAPAIYAEMHKRLIEARGPPKTNGRSRPSREQIL